MKLESKSPEELQEMLHNRQEQLIRLSPNSPQELRVNLMKNIIKLEHAIKKPWSLTDNNRAVANTVRRRCRK